MADATPSSAIRERPLQHYMDPAEASDTKAVRRHVVTLTGPAGSWDVTDRLMRGSIGTITSNTEQEFLVLTSGDVTLDLDNADGAVEAFFEGVQPSDTFEVTIERRSGRRAPRWDTLFGGVLDLPWSIRYNRKERTAQVQAFSYSKLLEHASAEAVRRSVTLTGSVTAGQAQVTVSPNTTDLRVGDEIQMVSGATRESQTILSITSSTIVTTADLWANTFAAGSTLNLLTPYYRDVGLGFLVTSLFDEAGVIDGGVVIAPTLSSLYPVATPLSRHGFIAPGGVPSTWGSATILSGNLRVGAGTGGSFRREVLTDPDGSWTATTPGFEAYDDWTARWDEKPVASDGLMTFGGLDNGAREVFNQNTVQDWIIITTGIQPYNGFTLREVGVGDRALLGSPAAPNTTTVYHSLDYDPVSGEVWVSICGNGSFDAPSGLNYDCTLAWDGVTLHTIHGNGTSGQLRYLRRLQLMALHERDAGATGGGAQTTNLHLYDPATRTRVKTVQVPADLWAWSLRVVDMGSARFILGIYVEGGRTYLRVWDANWTTLTDYKISDVTPSTSDSTVTYSARITVWPHEDLGEIAIVYTANVMLVLAKGYVGVVEHADFEGKSCAEALRQLALISACFIEVDEQKVASLRHRASEDAERKGQPIHVGRPLEVEEWPISEFYRSSCRVTGQTSAGDDIESIAGATGDSAHRLELDGDLVTTESLAQAIGWQYVGVLSTIRRQVELTIEETGDLIRPLDYIDLDGALWLVMEAQLDVDERTYGLRAVEVA